ncbi:hypothetical protein Q7P37_010999 [Cladosporium fusiforme]
MTALQPSFTPSFFGHGLFDTMPDQTSDQDWQHHHHQQNQQHNNYVPHMPMLTGQWAPQAQTQSNTQPPQQQQLLGMPVMDRRYYHENDSSYMAYTTTGTSNNLISPGFPPENTWSDMDIGTPSNNFDSPNDPLDSYSQTQPSQSRLQPPPRVPSNSKHSHAHAPSLSPHQEAPDPMSLDRPTMPGRSQTAPVVKSQTARPGKASTTIKASASDEAESDDDFVPSESNLNSKHAPSSTPGGTTASNRGRKRQRIPHTAVERRYRENLNAHLERLRQTVPSLASRRSSSGVLSLASNNAPNNAHSGHRASEPSTAPVATLLADGAKPSKCEILNGAIEHIGAVERENAALRDEVKELRARVEDLQRWYSATLRSAGAGAAGGFAG